MSQSSSGQKRPASPIPASTSLTAVGNDQLAKKQRLSFFVDDNASSGSDSLCFSSEAAEISKGLASNRYVLLIEHNTKHDIDCSAQRCQAQLHAHPGTKKIMAAYRLKLRTNDFSDGLLQNNERTSRYFHVSCLEAMYVDIARYGTLPPERNATLTPTGLTVTRKIFHPAIVDWVLDRGRAFHPNAYKDRQEEMTNYQMKLDTRLVRHISTCLKTRCGCGDPPEPPKAELRPPYLFKISGLRRLSDLLLETFGGTQIMPLREADMILILELGGAGGLAHIRASLDAAANAIRIGHGSGQYKTAADCTRDDTLFVDRNVVRVCMPFT